MPFYDRVLRPLLFRLDAERAHHLTLTALQLPLAARILRARYGNARHNPIQAFGISFPNRIGLAAGYDKNGAAIDGLSALGFGHLELGTVTRIPQAGNPRPRVHRVPEVRGVINSMGFPNNGVAALLQHLAKLPPPGQRRALLGINIGKGKDTPIERAAEDYCALYAQVSPYADYVAINISSPNTMNLRQLQAREAILELLKAVAASRSSESRVPRAENRDWGHGTRDSGFRTPILVKIAPDLSPAEIDDVLDAISLAGLDGVIATNTTLSREGVPAHAAALKGGLSGAPLTARATGVIAHIARVTGGRLPIIGVGGIMTIDDAKAKLDAGAALLQIYTGLIYGGPGLVKALSQQLQNLD